MNRLALAAAMTLAGFAVSQDASAILRLNSTNGAGVCQGALPNYEGRLRKRPTAIANEGTANAFISCSIQHDMFGQPALMYGLVVNNNSASDLEITCTLAAGHKINNVIAPLLIPKTFPVAAGGATEVAWHTGDNGGDALPPTGNWSCNLPPGTEIAFVSVEFEDGSAEAAP